MRACIAASSASSSSSSSSCCTSCLAPFVLARGICWSLQVAHVTLQVAHVQHMPHVCLLCCFSLPPSLSPPLSLSLSLSPSLSLSLSLSLALSFSLALSLCVCVCVCVCTHTHTDTQTQGGGEKPGHGAGRLFCSSGFSVNESARYLQPKICQHLIHLR